MTFKAALCVAVLGSVPLAVCACAASDTSTDAPALQPTSDASAGEDATGQHDAEPASDSASAQQDAEPGTDAPAPVDAAADSEPKPDAQPQQDAEPPPDAEPEPDAEPNSDSGPEPWPTCDTQPAGSAARTIVQVWQDNPSTATPVWISGVVITAISKGGCSAGSACQIFVQEPGSFESLEQGAHRAIKLFISGNTAEHFENLAVGDKVDVYAHAWRYNVNPAQQELLLQVNWQLRGCAKKTGTDTVEPIGGVRLTDLTVQGYEQTYGPLLVRVDAVAGKPGAATETFALWHPGVFNDAGPQDIVSASPYFLPGGRFDHLPTDGQTVVHFASITGVFGLFVPSTDAGTAPKYLMLYPRTVPDMPLAPVP